MAARPVYPTRGASSSLPVDAGGGIMRMKMQVACMPWGEIQGFNVWRDFHGDAGSSRPSRFAPGG